MRESLRHYAVIPLTIEIVDFFAVVFMKFLKTKTSSAEYSDGSLYVPANSSASLLFIYENEEAENKIELGADASLQIFSIYSKNSKIKNSFSLGANSKLEIRDIFSGNVSVLTFISLMYLNCSLSLVAKGTINKNERAKYFATASIEEKAAGANVNLEEYAYLLESNAKADLLPGLEIKNNEVSARHASSISQLDEEQIFYLMSRGLSKKEAKDEIVSGFLSRELGKIKELFGYSFL